MIDIENLKRTVQHNCDIIDAEHGQNYGLCIYLLRMRDYFRWHKQIPLHQDLNNDDIHNWIANTEEHWDQISGNALQNIALNGHTYKPFDSDSINDQLNPEGLIYSGGLGYGGIPLFFLAELDHEDKQNGFSVFLAGKEHSRGLFGTPAFFRDDKIIIRQEALKHLYWSRYDEWSFSKRENTLGRALSYYDFKNCPSEAIEDITNFELPVIIQHEIGEGILDKEFGPTWAEMILEFAYSKTEILLRAVRDLAADCMTTLPFLLAEQRVPSIHMFFAGYSDMRKELFPSLFNAYKDWQSGNDFNKLNELVEQGKIFWFDVGKKSMEMFRKDGKLSQEPLNQFIGNLSQ